MVAGAILSMGLQAQGIYRCGNAYSQTPCPGAESLHLNDPRQPDQKQQTDAAASQAARLAQTMEQTRIAEEKRLLADRQSTPSTMAEKPASAGASTVLKSKQLQPKHKKPDAFIAEVPGSEKPRAKKKKPKPQPV